MLPTRPSRLIQDCRGIAAAPFIFVMLDWGRITIFIAQFCLAIRRFSVVPLGLMKCLAAIPTLKRWAMVGLSLRDFGLGRETPVNIGGVACEESCADRSSITGVLFPRRCGATPGVGTRQGM